MDVVFLIDASKASIFNDVKDFIKSFAHKFVLGAAATRVALVAYGSDAAVIFGFTRYCCRKELDEALDKLDYPSFVSRRSQTGSPHRKRHETKWKRFFKHARMNSTRDVRSNSTEKENGKLLLLFIYNTFKLFTYMLCHQC